MEMQLAQMLLELDAMQLSMVLMDLRRKEKEGYDLLKELVEDRS